MKTDPIALVAISGPSFTSAMGGEMGPWVDFLTLDAAGGMACRRAGDIQ